MIFLDTNVVVWLAAGTLETLSKSAKTHINDSNVLLISPMVKLELQYLKEIKRISKTPDQILQHLKPIGLTIQEVDLLPIIEVAQSFSWTRDPFDRLITAHATLHNLPLLTKDKTIRKHYKSAIW